MQQRVPKGAEPTAAQKRTQPALEAKAEDYKRTKTEGLSVPGAHMRPPRPIEGSRRPDWDQKALLEKARREEVEVRQVLQEVCRAV